MRFGVLLMVILPLPLISLSCSDSPHGDGATRISTFDFLPSLNGSYSIDAYKEHLGVTFRSRESSSFALYDRSGDTIVYRDAGSYSGLIKIQPDYLLLSCSEYGKRGYVMLDYNGVKLGGIYDEPMYKMEYSPSGNYIHPRMMVHPAPVYDPFGNILAILPPGRYSHAGDSLIARAYHDTIQWIAIPGGGVAAEIYLSWNGDIQPLGSGIVGSPDGRKIAFSGATGMFVCDRESGDYVPVKSADQDWAGGLYRSALSNDGSYLVVVDGNMVLVFKEHSGSFDEVARYVRREKDIYPSQKPVFYGRFCSIRFLYAESDFENPIYRTFIFEYGNQTNGETEMNLLSGIVTAVNPPYLTLVKFDEAHPGRCSFMDIPIPPASRRE